MSIIIETCFKTNVKGFGPYQNESKSKTENFNVPQQSNICVTGMSTEKYLRIVATDYHHSTS